MKAVKLHLEDGFTQDLVCWEMVVGNRWIAQRLAMGCSDGLGRIADRVQQNAKLKKAYEKLTRMLQFEDF